MRLKRAVHFPQRKWWLSFEEAITDIRLKRQTLLSIQYDEFEEKVNTKSIRLKKPLYLEGDIETIGRTILYIEKGLSSFSH